MAEKQKFPDRQPIFLGVIWILLVIICVQAYFLHLKKDSVTVRYAPSKEQTQMKKEVPSQMRWDNKKGSAEIAIVLDDWGYNRTHCTQLREMNFPVGVAIIPRLNYSQDVIACAHEANHEPMLHLPLEPHRYWSKQDEIGVLTTDMSEEVLHKTLLALLDEMQGVVGVNNHMGSKATESLDVMGIVLKEVKNRKLFFVDSVTSIHSVVPEVADQLGMSIARRDTFLDNKNQRAYIEGQFDQAARLAQKRGYALMIGHDRSLTLEIIQEKVKEWKAQGVRVIPVSEYIKRYAYTRN